VAKRPEFVKGKGIKKGKERRNKKQIKKEKKKGIQVQEGPWKAR